jgi:type IV secretory pathway protease TraF
MIGTILIYEHTGIRGVCGQTVGADGRGAYVVVFVGKTVEATDEAARGYIKQHLQQPYIKRIMVISNDDTFSGNPIHVIEV